MLPLAPSPSPTLPTVQRPTPAAALLQWIDAHRYLLFALLLLAWILAFSGQWRLGNDSTLYVSLARNLAAGHGYHAVGWPRGNSHIGLPLMLSWTFRLFGPAALWPMLTLIFLMGIAALACTYRLLLFVIPRPNAVAAALLTGVSFTFTEYLYELLNEVPAFLGMIAALAAFEALAGPRSAHAHRSRWPWAILLIAGLALATALRPATWALMLAMAAVLLARALRHPPLRKTALVVVSLIALALLATWLLDPRHGHMDESHQQMIRKLLIEQPGQTLRTLWSTTLLQIFGPMTTRTVFTTGLGPGFSTLAALAILALTLNAARRRPLWLLWVAGTILMLLLYPFPQTRYYLPILPFIALGLLDAALWLGQKTGPRAAAMALLLALWILPSAARLARLAWLQHQPHFLAGVINGRYLPYARMDHAIDASLPPDALILSDDALALEALAPASDSRRFMMPMNIPPPDLLPQLPKLLDHRLLFAVDTGNGALDQSLQLLQLTVGPPLATIDRPAWDYPHAPERWFHRTPIAQPPPLVLRALLPLAASSAASQESTTRP